MTDEEKAEEYSTENWEYYEEGQNDSKALKKAYLAGLAEAIRDNDSIIDTERKEVIKKELGDVCWFISEIATLLDLDLESIMQGNLDKLRSRKERGVIHGSGDNR